VKNPSFILIHPYGIQCVLSVSSVSQCSSEAGLVPDHQNATQLTKHLLLPSPLDKVTLTKEQIQTLAQCACFKYCGRSKSSIKKKI